MGEGDQAFCFGSGPDEGGGGGDPADAGAEDGHGADDAGPGGDDGGTGGDDAGTGGDDAGTGGDDAGPGGDDAGPGGDDAGTGDDAQHTDWWNPDFRRRRKISFDNLEQGSLTNFPVMVRLDADRVDYAQTQDRGEDIRFIDADGATVLSHEIEKWDEGGASTVWVKVPEIFGSSDLDFMWIYYGNAAASALQDPNGVWTENYQAVYHLGDDFLDSSAPSFDGSNQGSDDKACVLADCQDFDDSQNDYIDLGSDRPLLKNVTGCTLSAVVNPESVGSEDYIVSVSVQAGGPTSKSRATLGLVDGNDVIVGGRSADGDSYRYGETTGNLIAAGNWHYLAGVLDYQNDRLAVYLNGHFIEEITAGFSQTRTSDTNSSCSAIGSQDDGSGNFFDGDIDEVRISGTVRSADWIAAQAKSLNDEFLLFGDQEAY